MKMTLLSTLVRAGSLALAGILSGGVSQAELIVSPTAVLQNELGLWRPGNEITNAIDQSGLSAPYVSGVTDLDAYLATNPTHQSVVDSTFFVSAIEQHPGNIDFDLGTEYAITSFVLWQQNRFIPEQITDFEIYTSNDPDFSASTSAGAFTAALAPVTTTLLPTSAQQFALTPTVARYVRLRILDSYYGYYCDLGEIAFGVLPVPEPSGWILSGGALAALGLVGRRKARANDARLAAR